MILLLVIISRACSGVAALIGRGRGRLSHGEDDRLRLSVLSCGERVSRGGNEDEIIYSVTSSSSSSSDR